METRTYTTLFDTKLVDDLLGDLHSKLETSYLERKDFMTQENQRACEARLAILRGTWTLLLDKAR